MWNEVDDDQGLTETSFTVTEGSSHPNSATNNVHETVEGSPDAHKVM